MARLQKQVYVLRQTFIKSIIAFGLHLIALLAALAICVVGFYGWLAPLWSKPYQQMFNDRFTEALGLLLISLFVSCIFFYLAGLLAEALPRHLNHTRGCYYRLIYRPRQ